MSFIFVATVYLYIANVAAAVQSCKYTVQSTDLCARARFLDDKYRHRNDLDCHYNMCHTQCQVTLQDLQQCQGAT